MREFSPLSETLKADGSNVAGVIAALPEEETADFEDRLTKTCQQTAGERYTQSMG